ncbi:MAG TPA: radical SAM protein [Elusimicrobiota bacterium]|nr:radical SAM protein [Elusimicrobiota bacterium]
MVDTGSTAGFGHLTRVYWETTAGCNLHCTHCRRLTDADNTSSQDLSTQDAFKLIDNIRQLGTPTLILSGGEALCRHDLFEIAHYAKDSGLTIGIATNGTLVDGDVAVALKRAGITYASVSLDGAHSNTHDLFRGQDNFARAIQGYIHLNDAGIQTQINLTVMRQNVSELPEMYKLAGVLGAHSLFLFLLVPVGCGAQIADVQLLSPQEVEECLTWAQQKNQETALPIKVICAPHYYRIEKQNRPAAETPPSPKRKGCIAGTKMCFISHTGDVFPCGYLPISCGNIKNESLQTIWERAPVLNQLRSIDSLKGRCGICDFKIDCGGCRARAYAVHRDLMAEEPYCQYIPPSRS